jgi:hypothetical protein
MGPDLKIRSSLNRYSYQDSADAELTSETYWSVSRHQYMHESASRKMCIYLHPMDEAPVWALARAEGFCWSLPVVAVWFPVSFRLRAAGHLGSA